MTEKRHHLYYQHMGHVLTYNQEKYPTYHLVSITAMLVPPHSPSLSPALLPFLSKAFVEEQNKLTMPYLEQCSVRAQLHQRLTELYDYPKYSCPYKRGTR